MDWSDLFVPVAEYLNFLLDLIVLDVPGRLVRTGRIDGTLLLYFSLSIALATAIHRQAKVPDFTAEPKARPRGGERKGFLDGQELLVYMPSLVAGGLGVHLGLVVWSGVVDLDIGNYRDTVNASIAASCLTFPLVAVQGRFMRLVDEDNLRQVWSMLALSLVLIAVMFGYMGAVTAEVHGLPWSAVGVPFALWLGSLMVLAFVIHGVRRFLNPLPASPEPAEAAAVG